MEEVAKEEVEEKVSGVDVVETPSRTPWWILSLILTALIMFFLGYYAGNRGALSSFFMKMATPAPQKVVVTDTIAKIDTVAKKDTVVKKDIVAKKDTVAKKDIVAKKDTVVKATVVKEPAKPLSPALAQAHNIVNTGAYIIEGTSETVVVKKGQTLSRISRTYLGEGMEAYVQVLNGVTEVKEGMSLKIPKLKVKKKKKR